MNVFIDANVLVAVLNKEYPVFTYAARVLNVTDQGYQLYTTPLCLAISFYFASKKSGEELAKKKLQLLAEKLSIAVVDQGVVFKSLKNKQIHDVEDGFQYYAALNHSCKCIVAEDRNDFYFSDIPVLSSEAFLEQHVFKK